MKQLVVNFLICFTLNSVHLTLCWYPPQGPTFEEFAYLGNTYDITGLDVYWHYKGEDTEKHDKQFASYKNPFFGESSLFSRTYSESKSFTIPSLNKTIWLPDQVSKIKVLDRTIVENMTYYGGFRENYIKWMAQQVGLGSLNYGAGSQLWDLGKAEQQNLIINRQVIVEASILVHLYNVTLNKTKYALADFNATVDSLLTTSFEENLYYYSSFLDDYGTHYFESATLGGRISIKYFIDSKIYFEKQSQIDELIKSDFKQYFATLIESNQSTIPGLKSRRYFQVGTFWSYPNNTLNQTEWLKHLPQDPSIVGGQLKPITDFIHNESIKTEVKKAIKYRMSEFFLFEMDDILNAIAHTPLPSRYFTWILFPDLSYGLAYNTNPNTSLSHFIWDCLKIIRHDESFDANFKLIYSRVTAIDKFMYLLRDSNFGYNCLERLMDYSIFDVMRKTNTLAAQKWKLPSDFKAKETCCAMYDSLTWVIKYTEECSICIGDNLTELLLYGKTAVDALGQSLCSTIPYDKYSEMCTQDGLEIEFSDACPEGYSNHSKATEHPTSSSHFKTWAIVLIAVLILTTAIIVLIGLYLYCQFFKQKHTLPALKSEAPHKEDSSKEQHNGQLIVVFNLLFIFILKLMY